MQSNSFSWLAQFKNLLQCRLFPVLEESVGPLDKPARLLSAMASSQPLSQWLPLRRAPKGRPPADRLPLLIAFFAKAAYNLPTTRHLIARLKSDATLRRLCGWESSDQIPNESTFSRAFAEFAADRLPERIHESLILATQSGRPSESLARDSTAIAAREWPPGQKKKERAPTSARAKTPTPKKKKSFLECILTPREVKRLDRQPQMNLAEMIAELPRGCATGVKTNSQGRQQYWFGYKLHWDVADNGRIPISCLLTGANVHDSQVAIPLMHLSAQRVQWKYDLADKAYSAKRIRQETAKLGHQAITPAPKPRAGSRPSFPDFNEEETQLFRKRTIVEQLNGRLKDEFGGRLIYVRGAAKVMAHLMFGVLALTVDQLLRLPT